MTDSESNSPAPIHGLYERLVSDSESAVVTELAAANMALISVPSQAQRRGHLIDQLAAQLPELLDAISSPLNSNSEQAQAGLKLITHLLREARLLAKQNVAEVMPAEPLQLLRSVHELHTSPAIPETGLRRPWIFTSARSDPSLLNEDKREGFGDRVQYHDYAISIDKFHWQTQNKAGAKNAPGLRYLESQSNGWTFQLFIREDANNAFIALGPVTLEEHTGNKPISIVWKLTVPMPTEVFRRFSVLRAERVNEFETPCELVRV